MKDLSEGDRVERALVVKRYISGLGGAETAVLTVPHHGDQPRVIAAMKKRGWAYHFTRDAVDKMWFREAEHWDMEPGAGNS
jgi:hypothetical protein